MTDQETLYVCYLIAWEGRDHLVFALSRADAKIDLGSRLGADVSAAPVERARWGDRWAVSGVVPRAVRLSRGLPVDCAECGATVTDAAPFFRSGDEVLCSGGCSDAHEAGIAVLKNQASEEAATLADARTRAEERWPECRVLSVAMTGGRPRVHFTYGAGRHAFWLADGVSVQIAADDHAEWEAFNAGPAGGES